MYKIYLYVYELFIYVINDFNWDYFLCLYM